MTVKGNMPTLYRKLRKLLWAAIPSLLAVSTDHGRRVRRTIRSLGVSAHVIREMDECTQQREQYA